MGSNLGKVHSRNRAGSVPDRTEGVAGMMCRGIGRDDEAELQSQVAERINGWLGRLASSIIVFAWATECVVKYIKGNDKDDVEEDWFGGDPVLYGRIPVIG
jgi:hypothetical protein